MIGMRVHESMKKMSSNWMFSAVTSMVIGLLLVLLPGFLTKAAGYLLGAAAVLFGVNRVLTYFKQEKIYPEFFRGDLMIGLLAGTLGVFVMLNVQTVVSLLPLVFGAILFSNGVVGVQRAVQAQKAAYKQWWLLLIFALLTLGLGVVLVINPFGSLQAAVTLIGAGLMYEGVSDLLTMMLAGKKIDGWKHSGK